jgi:CPA1 family monovalent cation:H+ antiporter
VFTTCVVAVAAHYVLGLPWAVGFLIGAIVSPPDVVAPLAIAHRLGMPRRLLVVLEGEGLANDATALILYRFAVVAITTGTFSFTEAAGTFAAIVVGEIAWGIGVGWLSLQARRLAHDPRVEIVLSLMTPYVAYWVPEHLGGSGVLATVATGLYVSWNGPLLISSATRLQGVFFWDLIIYVIEGFVFLLTGLEARTVLESAQTFSLREVVVAVAVVTAIIIAARFVWMFPAVYVPRWISPALRERDPAPPWTWAFALAFTGVRGVVSLAAALAIPFTLANGQPFPHRDLILFITYGVILITVVGLGLTLPAVIRWLGIARHRRAEEREEKSRELAGRHAAMEEALRQVEQRARERGLPEELLAMARTRHETRSQQFPKTIDEGWDAIAPASRLRMELITAEREYIYQLLRDGKITDESRRQIERELDLEEALITCRKDADPHHHPQH